MSHFMTSVRVKKAIEQANIVKDELRYTDEQIAIADDIAGQSLEDVRAKIKISIIDELDISKEWNIIVTPEGLGKSGLVPEYIKKFEAGRIVLLCKSYEQIADKKRMYNEFFPDLEVECIPSNEKFLDSYHILKNEWLYEKDEKTGETYVNVTETIKQSEIHPSIKSQALFQKEYFDSIIADTTHKDIVLMTEDKLKAEVLYKKNFRGAKELFCWDEFNQDNWFEWNHLSEIKYKMLKNVAEHKIIDQPTWSDAFNVRMIHNQIFTDFMEGRKIVLSTEKKAMLYFTAKNPDDVNVVYEDVVFHTPSVNIIAVNPGMIKKKDDRKKNLAMSYRVNGFSVWGNGVESTVNNTTMLGQNYHDRIKPDEKIILILSEPCPEQIAPLMKNLGVNDHDATIIYMSDILNQYLGRCNGFRDIKRQSFDVIISNKWAKKIITFSRYICNIIRGVKVMEKSNGDGHFKQLNMSDKMSKALQIIHTIGANINLCAKLNGVFMHTLKSNVQELRSKIVNPTGRYIGELRNKLKNLWCYKFPVKDMANDKLLKTQAVLLNSDRYTNHSVDYLYRLLADNYNGLLLPMQSTGRLAIS